MSNEQTKRVQFQHQRELVRGVCVKTYPFQLVCLSEPAGRCLGKPRGFLFFGRILQHFGIDVAWTDTIDPTKVDPFDREALC